MKAPIPIKSISGHRGDQRPGERRSVPMPDAVAYSEVARVRVVSSVWGAPAPFRKKARPRSHIQTLGECQATPKLPALGGHKSLNPGWQMQVAPVPPNAGCRRGAPVGLSADSRCPRDGVCREVPTTGAAVKSIHNVTIVMPWQTRTMPFPFLFGHQKPRKDPACPHQPWSTVSGPLFSGGDWIRGTL